jgi:DNA ligase 1
MEIPELEGLDGELICGDPLAEDCYRQTAHGVMGDHGLPEDFRFYAFDLWNSQEGFLYRHDALTEIVVMTGIKRSCTWLRLVQNKYLEDLEALNAYEAHIVELGNEGVVVRGPDSFYKFGRGSKSKGDLLKVKRFSDAEAEVIGAYEEMHNANEATTNALGRTERSSHKENKIGKGTLGGFYVKLLKDEGTMKAGVEFKIGTGFDASERANMWTDHEFYIGKIVKFKFFEIGVKDKPRHPVFLGFRDPDDM